MTITDALTPMAHALRGVTAGHVTATTTPGTFTPQFHISGDPVTPGSGDDQILQALHALGLIRVGFPKPGAPAVVELALVQAAQQGRTIDAVQFTVSAQNKSFNGFARALSLDT